MKPYLSSPYVFFTNWVCFNLAFWVSSTAVCSDWEAEDMVQILKPHGVLLLVLIINYLLSIFLFFHEIWITFRAHVCNIVPFIMFHLLPVEIRYEQSILYAKSSFTGRLSGKEFIFSSTCDSSCSLLVIFFFDERLTRHLVRWTKLG